MYTKTNNKTTSCLTVHPFDLDKCDSPQTPRSPMVLSANRQNTHPFSINTPTKLLLQTVPPRRAKALNFLSFFLFLDIRVLVWPVNIPIIYNVSRRIAVESSSDFMKILSFFSCFAKGARFLIAPPTISECTPGDVYRTPFEMPFPGWIVPVPW